MMDGHKWHSFSWKASWHEYRAWNSCVLEEWIGDLIGSVQKFMTTPTFLKQKTE